MFEPPISDSSSERVCCDARTKDLHFDEESALRRRQMKNFAQTVALKVAVLVAMLVATSALHAQTCAAGNGALKVTSFPSGANVSVDGVDTGKVTPMSISLAGGN